MKVVAIALIVITICVFVAAFIASKIADRKKIYFLKEKWNSISEILAGIGTALALVDLFILPI